MKLYNNMKIYTNKDGSIEDQFDRLCAGEIERPGFISNIDEKFLEKVLKNMRGTDEDLHPGMLVPLSYIFRLPPFEAACELTRIRGNAPELSYLIKDFLTHSQEWLHANRDLVLELFNLCPGAKIEDVQGLIFASELRITPEIEKEYLSFSLNRQDKFKRTKILAAVYARLAYDSLHAAIVHGDAQSTATLMFLFTRSMAQFASSKAVEDGLDRQEARRKGGEKKADRTGLLRLIKKYHDQTPTATDRELWMLIKNDLVQRKFLRPWTGYSVRFEFEPTDEGDVGGRLVQKKAKGGEHLMGFEAFKNARTEVRK